MANEFQNSSDIKANSFDKGMVKDYSLTHIDEGLWTHARNAINVSHKGEIGAIGNEPANLYCAQAPYTVIGISHHSDSKWVVFSTNNKDSEIGIFDEHLCSYTRTVNDPCLSFSTEHLVTAVTKRNYDCTYTVYFSDNNNPDRALNLDRVPYKTSGINLSEDPDCFIPEYTSELDCDAILLHPLVKQACARIKRGNGSGQLPNGSYQATIAYSHNGVRITDYSTPTVPVSLWNHTGIGGSLEIEILDIDTDYEEFELVVISSVNQQATAKKIGYYSTRQASVHLAQINQSLETIELAIIPLQNPVYHKSEKMFGINGYLIRTGVTTKPALNYQVQANNIKARWVSVEYPSDYYAKGGKNVGYMRDEVYPFFIRWIYNTGNKTNSYLISGRVPEGNDLDDVTGDPNALSGETVRWQVYDTSTTGGAAGSTYDGGTIKNKGKMSYWESTEKYPDNQPDVWGDLCGKPIRHHKFPSNETTHIHGDANDKIYVLGVEFYDIAHPLDENGNPVTDIVGYEILRGSREGNRSVIAKGMFNNMWEYEIEGSSTRRGLYQNYPYNDLRSDKFLSTKLLSKGDIEDDNDVFAPTAFRRDTFSFHSPETNIIKPYLGADHVKVYTVEKGMVRGYFQTPHKHPRHKLITTEAFGMALAVGLGIGLIAALGKTTTETHAAPVGAGFVAGRDAGIATAMPDIVAHLGLNLTASLQTGAGIVMLVSTSAYFIGMGMDEALDAFYKMAAYRDFAIQYNSHGYYDSSIVQVARRAIPETKAKYIGSYVQDFDSKWTINNLNRNKYVAVQTASDLPDITITDDTRRRVRDAGLSHEDPLKKEFTTNTAAYYGALKIQYTNQYGQIDSITQIPTDSCISYTTPSKGVMHTSPIIFGGDTYINRYTEKNPYYFFNNWLIDAPDGTEINYRNHINGPYPRYWADFNKFDITDFNITFSKLNSVASYLNPLNYIPDITEPSDFYTLDRPGTNDGFLFVKNSYYYLFCNGVRDFYTESELNMAFRDYGEQETEKFYDVYFNSFNDLDTMFRSDLIKSDIYYKYDLSLSASKLYNNFVTWGAVLPRDYDPAVYSSCFTYYPYRAIYSLQQQSGLKRDNWKNFLANNYYDFKARVNNIKSLNGTGAVILFEDGEPANFVGVDQLQTKGGVKITVGDGGLFQQNLQSIVNADDSLEYGSCQSYRSAVNTPHGLFWVSQKLGKVMNYAGQVDEISRYGMKHWFAEHLPSKLLEQFPDYPFADNPVMGVGCQAIYDSQYELLYVSKRDYVPKQGLLYEHDTGKFYIKCGEEEITTTDPDLCTTPVDLVFVLDITGSMGTYLSALKDAMSAIGAAVADRTSNNYRLGLVTVDEYWDGSGTSLIPSHPTVVEFALNNISDFNTNINTVTIGYGGGTPESTDIAISNIVDGLKTGISFNPDAIKMIVLITDAPAGGMDDKYTTGVDDVHVQSVADAAKDAGIKIYPISVGAATFDNSAGALVRSLHDIYADTTGGTHYQTEDGSGIEGAVVDAITTVPCPPQTVKVPGKCYIKMGDPAYFEDASWTVSYDPKQKMWISFHDWHPTLMLPTYQHFVTIQDNTFWKHNERHDKYVNYYGADYPWEVEFPVTTAEVTSLRSIEYTLENYIYDDGGDDYHHVLDANFDRALVYNSEQVSGVLRLNIKAKNNPLDALTYPKITPNFIEILYAKEENRYRFNQFWDITKDRGEFTSSRENMFITEANGYRRRLNPLYVNYLKSPLERKKFRHYGNRIVLRKSLSDNLKMILRLTKTKQLLSPR